MRCKNELFKRNESIREFHYFLYLTNRTIVHLQRYNSIPHHLLNFVGQSIFRYSDNFVLESNSEQIRAGRFGRFLIRYRWFFNFPMTSEPEAAWRTNDRNSRLGGFVVEIHTIAHKTQWHWWYERRGSQRLGNPRTHYYTYHIVLTHGCIEFFFVTLESVRRGQQSPGYSLCQRCYSIFRDERQTIPWGRTTEIESRVVNHTLVAEATDLASLLKKSPFTYVPILLWKLSQLNALIGRFQRFVIFYFNGIRLFLIQMTWELTEFKYFTY